MTLKHCTSDESYGACLLEMLMDPASWFLRIPKPWTTGSGVATERCGPGKNCWFWGNRTPPVTGLLLLQEFTTISKKGIFPGPVHLNYLSRQNAQSPSHTSGRILTANRWNLCPAADLWNIRYRNYYHKNPLKSLQPILAFFFTKLFPSKFCRMIELLDFRASGLSDMTEVKCQDSLPAW